MQLATGAGLEPGCAARRLKERPWHLIAAAATRARLRKRQARLELHRSTRPCPSQKLVRGEGRRPTCVDGENTKCRERLL